MENTGFKFEFRIFYFIDLQNEEDYERKVSIKYPPDVIIQKSNKLLGSVFPTLLEKNQQKHLYEL